MSVKIFDVHFEIGTNGPPTGDFYAKCLLGGNGVLFEENGPTPAAAISKVVINMENTGMWSLIAQNPSLSVYPFTGSTPAQTGNSSRPPVPAEVIKKSAPDPNAPKRMPGDLSQVTHPDCTVLCTSFEHFGKAKCKSMCRQRSIV